MPSDPLQLSAVEIVAAVRSGDLTATACTEAFLDRMVVYIRQKHCVVAFVPQGRLEELEMDGRHLGHQDGVSLPHFLGEADPFVRLMAVNMLDFVLFPLFHGGPEGPDPDFGGAKIAALVDFEDRIELIVPLGQLLHLVWGKAEAAVYARQKLHQKPHVGHNVGSRQRHQNRRA